MAYYVYLLASDRNRTLYLGVTNDIVRLHSAVAFTGGTEMFASIAGVALVLQLGVPAHPLNESIPLAQEVLAQEILAQEILAHEIRYRRHGHPPPCGHGYDLDERDGKCYPNGTVPPRFQSGRYYPLEYGGGRRPVPCGHGADRDIRDGLCYRTGTVPRQYQDGRAGYHYRRNGYYEMR